MMIRPSISSPMVMMTMIVTLILSIIIDTSSSFTYNPILTTRTTTTTTTTGWNVKRSSTWITSPPVLAAASKGGSTGGGKKKRRRRRKQQQEPIAETAPPAEASKETKPEMVVDTTVDQKEEQQINMKKEAVSSSSEGTKDLSSTTTTTDSPVPKFKFDRNEAIALGITNAEDEEDIPPEFTPPKKPIEELPKFEKAVELKKGAMDLPDLKDSVRKKQKGDVAEEAQDEKDETKDKIKRSDVRSFTKLLEIEPSADTDASFFEDEEYGTVSILLGEGAKPFLGIPSGPLQVGHFIGSLALLLMAFIDYPGFPLTNLPTPLRGALQGGLGTIYAINTVLAVLSTSKASERNQPKLLWAVKTFTVGGLAFDQLTQLPTAKQLEEMKAKKGKRAWKNKRK